MEPYGSFGKWLRAQREARDWTRRELAERMSCAVPTVEKIEVALRRPSKAMLARIFAVLDIPEHEHQALSCWARQPDSPSLLVAGASPQPGLCTARPLLALGTLIGREAEVRSLRKRIADPATQLLTVSGPPGVGKTRLALAAVEPIVADPQQCRVISFATVTDYHQVVSSIAQACGCSQAASMADLRNLLHARRMLLVLDGFEHLVSVAIEIAALAAALPGLTLLITSRRALNVEGEQLFPLTPLGLPPADTILHVDSMSTMTAVQLFVARAREARPDFTLSNANVALVVAICRRVDGLPFGVELTAAMLRYRSLAEIAQQIETPLDCVRRKVPLHTPEPSSLRTLFDASYRLLSDVQQRLFAALSYFEGGWTAEAAGAVWRAIEPHAGDGAAITDLLADLIDHSLVQHTVEGALGVEEISRYTMLTLTRDYAAERLTPTDAQVVAAAHAHYFLAMVEFAEAASCSETQYLWLDTLQCELPNIQLALQWFLVNDHSELARFVGTLARVLGICRGFSLDLRHLIMNSPARISVDLAVVPRATARD